MLKNHRIVPPPLGMVPAGRELAATIWLHAGFTPMRRGLTATIGFTPPLRQWGED
jgi:hypothetical protein